METVVRISFVYLFLLFMLRVMGKRELAQLSPFELTLIMLIPEIASQSLIREDYSMTNAVIGLSTLFTLVVLTSTITYVFPKVQNILEGEATILVKNGKLITKALDQERVTVDDIMSQIREVGIEKFSNVKWVILEADGKISVIPYESGEHNHRANKRITT